MKSCERFEIFETWDRRTRNTHGEKVETKQTYYGDVSTLRLAFELELQKFVSLYEDSKCYLLQSKEIDKGRKRERSHKRFSETEKILSDSNFSETLEHFLLFDSETEAIETVENVWNFFMLRKKIPPKMFCFYL